MKFWSRENFIWLDRKWELLGQSLEYVSTWRQAINYQCALDPAVLYKRESGRLLGVHSAFTENILYVGNNSYVVMSEKTEKTFWFLQRSWNSMQATELQLRTIGNELEVDQWVYISRLAQVQNEEIYNELWPLRARLATVSDSRPNINCGVAILPHVAEGFIEKETN